MKKFMIYIEQEMHCNNRLQKEVQNLLKDFDRKIIVQSQLALMKNRIKCFVNACNIKYPQCTPVKIEFNESHLRTDIFLEGFFPTRMRLLSGEDWE